VAVGKVNSLNRFGTGFYYNKFSGAFKNDISALTSGTSKASDETGIEVFYDFAITPAIRFVPSYQHIWNPLVAEISSHQYHVDVFLARLSIYW
jgi:porin